LAVDLIGLLQEKIKKFPILVAIGTEVTLIWKTGMGHLASLPSLAENLFWLQ